MGTKLNIYHQATTKYLKAPTHEQIFSFIDEVGVPMSVFERYFGMATDVLRSVKAGFKQMPRRYWHIFYERVVPVYGCYNNFQKPEDINFEKTKTIKPKRKPRKKPKMVQHSRLSQIK